MIDYIDEIYNLLVTAGIEIYKLPRLGLNRTTLPQAFTNGLVKPICIITSRDIVPNNQVVDEGQNYRSAKVVVELWLYQDSDYDQIKTMSETIYTALNGKPLSVGMLYWDYEVRDGYDTNLGACCWRVDYGFTFIRK